MSLLAGIAARLLDFSKFPAQEKPRGRDVAYSGSQPHVWLPGHNTKAARKCAGRRTWKQHKPGKGSDFHLSTFASIIRFNPALYRLGRPFYTPTLCRKTGSQAERQPRMVSAISYRLRDFPNRRTDPPLQGESGQPALPGQGEELSGSSLPEPESGMGRDAH